MAHDALSDFDRFSIYSGRAVSGSAAQSRLAELVASKPLGNAGGPNGSCQPAARPFRRQPEHERPTGKLRHVLKEHRSRVAAFSVIGIAVFLGGLTLQALLVQVFGFTAMLSYAVQAVVSIEVSFLLNRRFTWPDRDVSFWQACWRFNVQKAAMSVVNVIAYEPLVRFGMNYLVANAVMTVVFTIINYVGGDKWSFVLTRRAQVVEADPLVALGAACPEYPEWENFNPPTVSVVIPCKNNQRTIRATVESLLNQDYSGLNEVILVGSSGDLTWSALGDIQDPRLVFIEQESTPGKRDPNIKRDTGIRSATGHLLALADSDIVMDPDWLSTAVRLMFTARVDYVAGGMRSIHKSFWGRFVDCNRLAAKTPRVSAPYLVTHKNFGKRGRKPPITANALFTRDLYNSVPLDVGWAYGYEDYEWMWRVMQCQRFRVLYSNLLPGRHHHRRRMRELITEYRRAAEGCAHFIRVHPDSPLARKRRRQAFMLPAATVPVLAGTALTAAAGRSMLLLAAASAAAVVMMGREVISARRLEAVAYPYAGAILGIVFTWSLTTNLIRRKEVVPTAPVWSEPAEIVPTLRTRLRRRISWPLAAILAVQAVFSLSLVWSNTAFADEADYLWQGRMEWAHWLHGSVLPTFGVDSGAPQFYPPLGAIANAIGGLAGARVLSLCFMLISTALVYLITVRLFGTQAAVAGSALWAVTEPVLRLAFATYDAMACLLIILSVWLGIQAAVRFRRGELVALSALSLALGSITAFSFAIMVPIVILVLFLAWQTLLETKAALWCSAWLGVTSITLIAGIMTALHLWTNIAHTTVDRSAGLGNGVSAELGAAWYWDGLLFALSLFGVIAALTTERNWGRKLLVSMLAVSGIIVVAYQAHLGTNWSLDKHMSAGTGFMAIAAGYGLSKIKLSAWKPLTAWIAALAVFCYPAITGLWYARNAFHSWDNTAALISVVRSLHAKATIGIPQDTFFVVQYYLPTQYDGTPNVPGIETGKYPIVVLTLDASFNSAALPKSAAAGQQGSALAAEILRLAANNSGNNSQYPIVKALELAHKYRIAKTVPYSTTLPSNSTGLFVVWQRIGA